VFVRACVRARVAVLLALTSGTGLHQFLREFTAVPQNGKTARLHTNTGDSQCFQIWSAFQLVTLVLQLGYWLLFHHDCVGLNARAAKSLLWKVRNQLI
jgi:hypothetical protein